jgi:CheY-like chemotaxis protein
MRVLVIEDDEELAGKSTAGLREARLAVDVALDGEAGLARALVHDYEVIVLDHDLPAVHGDEICANLVAAGSRSRVLILIVRRARAARCLGRGRLPRGGGRGKTARASQAPQHQQDSSRVAHAGRCGQQRARERRERFELAVLTTRALSRPFSQREGQPTTSALR